MSWAFSIQRLRGITVLSQLVQILGLELPRLSRLVRCYEPVGPLTYGTTVQVGGDVARVQLITVTNATAFTIANPRSPREGAEITLDVFNNTAGAIGAITFGTEYQTAGAFVNPAAGKHRLIAFYRSVDSKWRETWRGAADI